MTHGLGLGALLVTGAGGFIGGNVVAAASAAGWDVTACSRTRVDGVNVEWVRPDDLSAREVPSEFDAVIHLAGNSDHGLAARDPAADLEATGVGSARLLAKLKAEHLVVLSSAAVYAGAQGLVGPSVSVHPLMAYALSKLYVEGLAEVLTANGAFERLTVVRLYNAFGPGERVTRLIPRVVAACQARTPVILTGDPTSLSDPVHVSEVARVLLAAARTPGDGRFDLAGGDPVPLLSQIERIASLLNLSLPGIVTAPDSTQTPIHFYSDASPLVEALGIEPIETFAAGLKRYATEMGWQS